MYNRGFITHPNYQPLFTLIRFL